MSRRGENIRKRTDGRWEGRIKEPGSISYKSIYAHSYSDVKRKMREYLTSIEQNKKADTYTLKDALARWLAYKRVNRKSSTITKYEFIISSHILPKLGKVPVCELTSERLNGYLTDEICHGGLNRATTLSPSYVKTMMIIINSALKFAYDEGRCALVTARLPINTSNRCPKVLTFTEQKAVEAQIIGNPTLTGLGVIIALRMGLRVGEICALKWDDVDQEKKTLNISTTVVRCAAKSGTPARYMLDTPKTKSSFRSIPIPEIVFRLLTRLRHSGEFILTENRSFLNPSTFEYRYHKLLRDARIRDLNFHSLRHTFATRCIESGMDDKTLSELLGHSNVNITLNTYVHSSMALKRKQIENLSVFLDQ